MIRSHLGRAKVLIRGKGRECLVRAGRFRRPSFLIIGAQKSGTTALFTYLRWHPKTLASRPKEIHFFNRDENYRKGLTWYHTHFLLGRDVARDVRAFEATPAYLASPEAPSRIFDYDPSVRLVVLLRNPIDRAYSAWNMFRQFERDPAWQHLGDRRDFRKAVEEERRALLRGESGPRPRYLERGLYHDQLQRYCRLFGRQQVHVLSSDSLRRDPAKALARICEFVGLPQHDWDKGLLAPVHVRTYDSSMDPDVREVLRAFFRPHNERLSEFLGTDLKWD